MALVNKRSMIIVVGKGMSIPTKIREKSETNRIVRKILIDLVAIRSPFVKYGINKILLE